METTDKNLEIEIKLQLRSFTDYLKLVGFLGQIENEEHQLNGFFDTEDRQLAKAGWAFRVRAENRRGLITIKSISKQAGMAVIRQEIEAEITRGAAMDVLNLHTDPLSLEIMPVQFIMRDFPKIQLAKLIQFNNTRQKKLFRIGDTNYLLELDKSEYSDGSVDYELEVELNDTKQIEVVEDHLRKLFGSLGIPFERQAESKFSRALNRAGLR